MPVVSRLKSWNPAAAVPPVHELSRNTHGQVRRGSLAEVGDRHVPSEQVAGIRDARHPRNGLREDLIALGGKARRRTEEHVDRAGVEREVLPHLFERGTRGEVVLRPVPEVTRGEAEAELIVEVRSILDVQGVLGPELASCPRQPGRSPVQDDHRSGHLPRDPIAGRPHGEVTKGVPVEIAYGERCAESIVCLRQAGHLRQGLGPQLSAGRGQTGLRPVQHRDRASLLLGTHLIVGADRQVGEAVTIEVSGGQG
jgi:hypothetical protein